MPANSLLFAVLGLALSSPAAAQGKGKCRELGIGESQIVQQKSSRSPTGTGTRYRLRRLKEKEYRVEVRYRFRAGEGYDLKLGPEALQEMMAARARECFAFVESRLLDLRSGASMRLELSDAAEVPEIPIEITEQNFRDTNLRFSSNIDCSALLHETFHHLGLVDEYPEMDAKAKRGYHCRPSGPDDSIMNSDMESIQGMLNVPKGEKRSILYPAHFRVITRPGCETVNGLYYRCAQFSYDTSSDPRCYLVPPECVHGNSLWLAGED